MEKKSVLVTGIGGNVAQGIIRNIKDTFNDIQIVGTDLVDFTAGNHLCNKTYKLPYYSDEKYIETICNIVKDEKIDLIIPSTDFEICILAENKAQISAPIAASAANVVKTYLDKYESYIKHKRYNIPFVETWLASEFLSSNQEIIAKPRQGRGSRGILINPKNPNNLGSDYVVQPLIKGKEITSAIYVTRSGNLHGTFTMERELSNGTTSKSKVTFDYDDAINIIAKNMIKAGGLYGSFNIQSIVTSDGNINPFEVNCRISGTNSIRHNLGFKDVVYTIQEYLFNQEPQQPSPIMGIATRYLVDVIYPGAINENALNNINQYHIIY